MLRGYKSISMREGELRHSAGKRLYLQGFRIIVAEVWDSDRHTLVGGW